MNKFWLIGIVGLVLGCAKTPPSYQVDLTSNVIVDSCTSIHVSVQANIEQGAEISHKGVLLSMCPNPLLTDPEGATECYERPDIYVTDSTSSSFTVFAGYYLTTGENFKPGIPYYTRPFVVIEHIPYYGNTVEFMCQ